MGTYNRNMVIFIMNILLTFILQTLDIGDLDSTEKDSEGIIVAAAVSYFSKIPGNIIDDRHLLELVG